MIEKKPLSTEPDQKMAENKVTVIHKIGFKVQVIFDEIFIFYNTKDCILVFFSFCILILILYRTARFGLSASQWTRTRRSWRWATRSVEPMCGTWTWRSPASSSTPCSHIQRLVIMLIVADDQMKEMKIWDLDLKESSQIKHTYSSFHLLSIYFSVPHYDFICHYNFIPPCSAQ